jgi:hypothetical protein
MKAVLVLAVLVTVIVPGVADAGSYEHCSYRLVPLSRQGSTTTATADLIGCYETYEEAVEAGFSGTVDVDPGVTPESLTDEDLFTTQSFDVLIGTEWNGASYTLSSSSYYASTTCNASNTWELNYVGSELNDTFESGKGFGGCDRNKKFEHADFGGDVVTCKPNCNTYGVLENEISSLRWKP